ncbi:MAG: hypothetical protein ACHP7O_04475 [Burkholderiales bacterium]
MYSPIGEVYQKGVSEKVRLPQLPCKLGIQLRDRYSIVRWSIVLLAILLLSACGFSPSDSEIDRALTLGDPLIGKIYMVRNIHRINGYERPDGYVVEFSAEIYILERPAEYFSRLAKGDQTGIGALTAFGLAAGGLAKWGLVTAGAISAATQDDIVPFSGTITMIKSEQGWILRPD